MALSVTVNKGREEGGLCLREAHFPGRNSQCQGTEMVCEEQLVEPAWGEEGGEVTRLLS